MRKRTSASSTLLHRPMRARAFVRALRMPVKAEPDRSRSSSANSKLSMAYRVAITPRAERDLASLYLQINAADSEVARQWYLGLVAGILSLRRMPNRNPVTPENKRLRHLLYGGKPHVYHVIFRVLSKYRIVQVLPIRPGARHKFRASGLT